VTHDHVDNWFNESNVFVYRTPKWYKQANCIGISGDIFFEEGVRRLVIEAKTYCNLCPVRVECLEHAIKYEEVGIWGGMTTKERRREVRRRIIERGASKQTKRKPGRAARRKVASDVRMDKRRTKPSRLD
jgi:WhiB family redox-sensing transcriptional regulator